MTGKALICRLGQHIPIEGADKIVQVNIFGETIVTSIDNNEGDIGLLFDCETQLSHEYASKNNMYRHSNLNTDKEVTGYLEDDRRIRPIKLRGVKVSGLWMPIETLSFIDRSFGYEASKIQVCSDQVIIGAELNIVDNIPLCEKYIPKYTIKASHTNKQGKTRRKDLVPTFKEHFDTDQWGRNSHKVQENDLVIITEKLHGTSFRCGNMLTLHKENWWDKFLTFFYYLLSGIGIKDSWEGCQQYAQNYDFVVGSRRVVKSIGEEEVEGKDHYYNQDLWTNICSREFKGKLRKGETIYGEIVGYTPTGEAIMGRHSNEKLKKFMDKKEYKAFIDKYGDTTEFTYGCRNEKLTNSLDWSNDSQNKVFVYRITMTNEDGHSIDLSWEQVKNRCDQLNVSHVPELERFIIHHKELSSVECNQIVEELTEVDSKNFRQHLNEGVAIRIENSNLTPQIYKNKRYLFKVLEGIIKDTEQVDIEESN